MSLALLSSRDAVLTAMREFDDLGRDQFLAKYGYGRARSYFVEYEGRMYDSKALAGVAVAVEHPDRGPLQSSEFSGGDETVKRKLEQLGFHVVVGNEAGGDRLRTWWVNQGTTFELERAGGYVWAPKQGKGGQVFGHHSAVAELRKGDLVFHYAKGFVRSIGVVREPAREEPRPDELPQEPWQSDGYFAPMTYHDAPTPIALEEIPAAWRTEGGGPFTRHGGVKQGYLFPLTGRFITRFVDEFGSRWPALAEITTGVMRLDYFDEFLGWGKRFVEWDDFDRDERTPKLEVAARIADARQAHDGGGDWRTALLAALRHSSNNLLPWQVVSRLVAWIQDEESTAGEAFVNLWSPGDWALRAETFLEGVPREVVSGRGTRAAVLSFFSMGDAAEEYPIYRPTPFQKAYELTAYEPVVADATEVEIYEWALGFLDALIAEADRREIRVRDRLEAQGMVWALTRTPAGAPPVSMWAPEEREEFLRYRGELPPPGERSSLQDLADSLLLDVEYLQAIERLLRDKGQAIFYGPPGTGKTYVARQLALYFAASSERVRLVQFHPSYAYEDFVEGYRPQQINGQPGFGLVPGPLKLIAEAARGAPEELFVLIIDEINRGNVAKVFGELYFLLEYRDERIDLQYSADEFGLPANLWVVGTMNTADRSIALLDAALRRRFYFIPFFPDEPPVAGLLGRWLRQHKPELEWGSDLVDRANAQLGDRNVGIGPSYFMRANLTEEWVELIWQHSIVPYLGEQFFGEEDRLAEFELDRLRFGRSQSDEPQPASELDETP